jgi:hypothetical protein
VKVRGDDGGLTRRSVYCFFDKFIHPEFEGKKT